MSDEARGIHDHPNYKLGRKPPKDAPALRLGEVLTGTLPPAPPTADHFDSLAFGLYENDRLGDCGPTSVANLVRLVSGGLLGTEVQPSQSDVLDLYRRSTTPPFNPATGANDNGVDMQTMLEALLAGGIGDGKGGIVRPLAFAKVDVTNDAELDAAVSIFGGALWGVNLLSAQQSQTDAQPPKWDYAKSAEWGGHAILNGAYESGALDDVITWAKRVETTEAFRSHQLEEAWVVVWPWNIEHPAFQQGIDVAALAAAYKELTGRVLPVPAPAPTPAPTPPTPAPPAPDLGPDETLWQEVKGWTEHHHEGQNRRAAQAVKDWAAAKGYS